MLAAGPQHPSSSLVDVPIARGPSLFLPPPVTLPQDIHPLPENVTDYVRQQPDSLAQAQLALDLTVRLYVRSRNTRPKPSTASNVTRRSTSAPPS